VGALAHPKDQKSYVGEHRFVYYFPAARGVRLRVPGIFRRGGRRLHSSPAPQGEDIAERGSLTPPESADKN